MAIVPRWLVEDTTISGHAKLVYLALSSRISRENIAWPSHKLLAAESGTSVSTVQRALRELRDLGVLTWRAQSRGDQGQTSNEYTLLMSPWQSGGGVDQRDWGLGLSDRGGQVSVTDKRIPIERTPMNDSFGLLAGPPDVGRPRRRANRTTKEVVAAFVRDARARGFDESDVHEVAGLVGLCVKAARNAGAPDSEIKATLVEVLDASDPEIGIAGDLIGRFEPLGVVPHDLGELVTRR